MTLTISVDDLVRQAQRRLAEDTGAQLHAQAQVALKMAADEAERYARKLLAAEPEMTADVISDRIVAHLRSLIL